MGLDISYYRQAKYVREYPEDGDYDYPNEIGAHVNPDFPEQADGLISGIYTAEDEGGFRAGSYGGYNQWRSQLAGLAGYTDRAAFQGSVPPGSAFLPLINFSDCEGVIGPKTSAQLAADFAEYQHAADRHPDDWFRQKYADWRTAFETASDNGFVDFH